MNARPKLLHSYKDFYPPVIGGMERHISAVCEHFSTHYDTTALVCAQSMRGIERNVGNVRVIESPSLGRFRSAPLPIGYANQIRALDPDLLHFHMPNPTCELAGLRAKPRGRIVVTYHSDIVRQRILRKLYAPYLRKFLDRVDVVIATTPRYADSSPVLQSVRKKVRPIPLGIETARWSTVPDEHAHRIDEMRERFGGAFLLFAGRLRYYKGVRVLIEAMSDVDAHVAIVGTGLEEDALKAQAASAGLEDRVHFLGDVDEDTLRVLYHAAAVFVLPAIARSEAYGLVQLEAHAAGTPVVSTALGTGVDYVNAHELTGLIVPPEDSRELAAALNRLLRDVDLRSRLGQQAQRRALAEFDEAVMFSRIGEVYRELLER